MFKIVLVSLGGSMGAILRYWVYSVMQSASPEVLGLATLVVNVMGSFVLGLVITYVGRQNIDHPLLLFMGVGVLGAFTTFSTFSLESVLYLQQGLYLRATAFILLNVCLSIIALYLGIVMIKLKLILV